jgi:hypothetical protein
MKTLSGKEFAKIIEKNRWKLARVHQRKQAGAHFFAYSWPSET